jgi:putative polymerase
MMSRRMWRSCSLVIAAATFNMVLCFLNTQHMLAASESIVIVSEVVIIALAAAVSYRFFLNTSTLIVLLLFVAYFCATWLITGVHTPKTIRNILIPVVFFALGSTSAKPDEADRLLYFLMILVLIMALWEWLFLDSYTTTFNILSYYVAKRGDVDMMNYAQSNLFGSAFRYDFEAGNSLQLFGSHRVSSIFLEPVSIGSFATISFIWLWIRRKTKVNGLFLAICAFLTLLSDSRFGLFSIIILMLADFMPILRSRVVIFAMPFVFAAVLAFIAWMLGPRYIGDDLTGRLTMSGLGLLGLEFPEWFGDFGTKEYLEADAGYAHVVYSIGLVGCVALWTLFSASTPRATEAIRFKTLIATYVCLFLCIGAAALSIKTAALLWFLYGALQSRSSEEKEQTFEPSESPSDRKLNPLPGLAAAPRQGS